MRTQANSRRARDRRDRQEWEKSGDQKGKKAPGETADPTPGPRGPRTAATPQASRGPQAAPGQQSSGWAHPLAKAPSLLP